MYEEGKDRPGVTALEYPRIRVRGEGRGLGAGSEKRNRTVAWESGRAVVVIALE